MLKSLIAKHLNVSERRQELRYKRKRCRSIQQIGQLQIGNGDVIQLIELNDDEIDADNVIVITLNTDSNQYRLHCSNSLSINEFKKEVFV